MKSPSYSLCQICIGFCMLAMVAVAQDARDPFAASKWSLEQFKQVFSDVLLTNDSVKGAHSLTSGAKYEIQSELRKQKISYHLPEPVLLPQVVRCLNAEIEAAKLNYRVRLELRPIPEEDAEAYFERMLLRAMDNNPNRVNALRDRSLGEILWTTAASVNASIVVYDNGVIVIAHRVGS